MDAEQSAQWTCPAAKVQAVDSMDMVNAHCDDCEAAVNVITQVDEDNANISYANGGPRFHLALSLHSILASILVCMQKEREREKKRNNSVQRHMAHALRTH